MNKLKLMFGAMFLCALSSTLQSCGDDDKTPVYSAVVTVIPGENDSFVMQLDENTVLQPVNVEKSPYQQKEVRALINFIPEDESSKSNVKNVILCWIDSIRTKLPVETLGKEEDIAAYGNDQIEIVKDWLTVAEDGYLTLRVRTLWGRRNAIHHLNLVAGTNPDNPLEFVLRHDAKGDTDGNWGDALIAFNLNQIPEIKDNDVKITLKWNSFSGEKSADFYLQVRKDVKSPSDLPSLTNNDYFE